MKGEKFLLAVFSGAAFISGFFLTFLVFLASLAAGNSLPIVFYFLAFLAVGYAFFDVFKSRGERRYVFNAAVVSSVLAFLPFMGKAFLNVFSGALDSMASFLFDASVSSSLINFDIVFLSIYVSFNFSALLLYLNRKGFRQYSYLAFLAVPLAFYLALSLTAQIL